MDNYLNYDQLGTFAGVVTASAALVQVLKRYVNISPRWLNLAVTGVLTFGFQILAKGDVTPQGLFLCFLNWIIATGAAGGMFDYIIQPVQDKIQKGSGEDE